MRLYEYEAKKLFKESGIPVPKQYGIIHKPEELKGLHLKFPCMLKAMVLTGGRGKAGGIKKADNLKDAVTLSDEILHRNINGFRVKQLLIEAAVQKIDAACYIGVTVNPATFNNIVIASAEGGIDIEETAKSRPHKLKKIELNENNMELPGRAAREIAKFLNKSLKGNNLLEKKFAETVTNLYRQYQKFDCKVAEINPFIISGGKTIAVDAKIVLDDNALYRQSTLLEKLKICKKRHDVSEATLNEQRAQKTGFPYLDLLPEGFIKDPEKLYVGLVPGGAGYGIFSIDEAVNIGKRYFNGKVVPVNFMDSGGGPTLENVAEMFNLLMDYNAVDMIITSRFGGISSCDIFIRGLVKCMRDRFERGLRIKPVFGRMVGTDLPGARTFLEKAHKETPAALRYLKIAVGNRYIFAEVMRKGIIYGFKLKRSEVL
jgi:succinyl-CoA synthetase beta subunit